jgi:hypothetical protein
MNCTYDPRGFKTTCLNQKCKKVLYIPWETMNDAGYCDDCVKAWQMEQKVKSK